MMRGWFLFLCMLTASAIRAEEAPAAAETGGENTVADTGSPASAWLPPALVAFGDVDDSLVQRAKDWIEQNLAIPVDVMPAQPMTQLGTLDEVSQLAASMLPTNRIGMVVLWRPNADVPNHGAFYPGLRVAVANLHPMLTPDTEPETIERRIDRQAIRGVCLLFGLEPSPNPYSAMYSYGTLEELDTIGRNLDPPWLKRLQERAVELGIQVDQENEFNMLQ